MMMLSLRPIKVCLCMAVLLITYGCNEEILSSAEHPSADVFDYRFDGVGISLDNSILHIRVVEG